MPPASTFFPRANDRIDRRQIEHSSYMRLLAALMFEKPDLMISNTSTRPSDHNYKEDLRYLETIATCMVTGEKGNVIASAFWRDRQFLNIVLAGNDVASKKDEGDSKEFLKLLKNADNKQLDAFVPFLVKRGKASLQHQLDKVGILARGFIEGTNFNSIVKDYCRGGYTRSLQLELPKRGEDFLSLLKVEDSLVSGADLRKFLERIIEILTGGLDLDKEKDTTFSFILFANAAVALSQSKIFQALATGLLLYENRRPLKGDPLPKFKRNLDKMRKYLRISEVVDFIQTFSSVRITWVPKDIAAPKHVGRQIRIPGVFEVAIDLARQFDQKFRIEDFKENLVRRCPHWEDYEEKIYIMPRLHAEIQIVLFLAKHDRTQGLRPVGCSKRSCLQCAMAMEVLDNGRWRTAGAHAWPYNTAALIGDEKCDDMLCHTIKGYAIKEVQQLLRGGEPAYQTHRKKNSEDYATASE